MLAIKCPNCKRLLRAHGGDGEHRATCPGCGTTFSIMCENGFVRTLSTSVSSELPPPEPLVIAEEAEPPELLPAINSSVFEDEGSKRTRRIHAVFKIVFLGTLAFFAYMSLSDPKGPPVWSRFFAFLPAVLFLAFLLAGGSAIVVGNLISLRTETHKRGEQALRRMWKAYDERPPPLDPSDSPRRPAARRGDDVHRWRTPQTDDDIAAPDAPTMNVYRPLVRPGDASRECDD